MILASSWELTHTITVTEVLWTSVTFVGLCANLYLLMEANRDYLGLRALGINSLREYVARQHMVLNMVMCFVQFSFVVIGMISMVVPSAPIDSGHIPYIQVIIATMFIFDAFILTVIAVFQATSRKIVLSKDEKE